MPQLLHLSLRNVGCLLLSFRNPAVSTRCLAVLQRGGDRADGVSHRQRCGAEVSELSVFGNSTCWIQRLTFASLHTETQASVEAFIQSDSQDFPAGIPSSSPLQNLCRADWKPLCTKSLCRDFKLPLSNCWLGNSTGLPFSFLKMLKHNTLLHFCHAAGPRSPETCLWWISCKQAVICTEFMLLSECSILLYNVSVRITS